MLPTLARAGRDLVAFLDARGRLACVIGGVAVSRWGEPRATQDVDLVVLADFGQEQVVLKELLSRYPSRIANPEAFAAANRIALLDLPGGVKADVSLGAFRFEREAVERATDWELPGGVRVRTCSAEDLIVYKLVAGRPGDIQDIIRIVQRQGGGLDVERIRHWGSAFGELKEDPDLLRPFEDALKKILPGP